MEEAHRLLLAVPEYRALTLCRGFFLPHRGGPSVLQDILNQGRSNQRAATNGAQAPDP